jgi:hypothetical protein
MTPTISRMHLQALAGPGAGPNGGQLYIDGFTGGQLPPKESIPEIRINQNPFSAEYDRVGFGRIEILTKPGADKLRGTLFLNDSDATFDSRNPFASNKPDYSNRQYGGYVGGPLNKRASHTLRSGGPFDVLLGEDLYGDTFVNARAAFAPLGSCPAGFNGIIGDIVCSPAGNFTTRYDPAHPANLVPRNYLTVAGLVSVNARVYHVFGFGGRRGNQAQPGGGGGGFGGGRGGERGGGMRMGPPGGGRGMMGGGTTEQRFNRMLGITVTNVINHFNPSGYQCVITSPQFLQPTTVNTGFGGGGSGGATINNAANNRRVEFDLRFTF